jgi:nicotinate-nucleotide adenylyltransferase
VRRAIRAAFISCHLQAAPPPGLVGAVGSVATSVVPILVGVRSGLLGGTFDPPHIAHLLAGEVAYRQLGLDRVIYLPAGSPWQKADRKVSSAGDRWRMTEIATAGIPYFVPDDREVHRDGWTYTIDTLATFEPSEEIVLILGADAARGLPSWEKADQVLERVRVAVLPRPGTERAEVESAIGAPIWLDMPALPVSGTMIRERFMAGTGVRFLIPDGVYDYMVDKALYQENPEG